MFSIEGMSFFLSEKLSQDPLENIFGIQPQVGRSNENPTIDQFVKNTQDIRIIDSISLAKIGGNCCGTKRKVYKQAYSPEEENSQTLYMIMF